MPGLFASLCDNLRLQSGLRNAQAGALYAIASHFTVSDANAIVSLPTGTGKTLVAVLAPVMLRANRVLVVTPSRIIRNQVAGEFRSLSLARSLGLLPKSSPRPNVKRITKRLSTLQAWQSLTPFDVAVATPNVASPAYSSVAAPPPGLFDLVIIDEAHHTPARTWRDLLLAFPSAKKLLLTATPYRRDRHEVPGTILYSYPLSRALSDGIYAPIEYVAAEPLHGDRDAGLLHTLKIVRRLDQQAGLTSQVLIRTDTIPEAERLTSLYQREGIRVKVIHSGKLKASTDAIKELERRTIDGLVCVDMLSEGFDLPALKIAVLHSPHRSLPATLQFIGRLARPAPLPIGPARVVAIPTSDSRAKTAESDLLRLYQRDSDWQLLIPGLAAGAMEREERLRGFFGNFRVEGIESITLRALRPPFRGIVLHAQEDQVDLDATPDLRIAGDVVFHAIENDVGCVVWITRLDNHPQWVNTDRLILTELHLHLAVFDHPNGLLFLQSPFPATTVALRDAIAPRGQPVEPGHLDSLLSNEDVRDIFNVGIANVAPRAARRPEYTMYAGRQADGAIRQSEVAYSTLGHASALVRVPGSSATEVRGASMRSSSVWSSRRGTILDLVDWCNEVGGIITRSGLSAGWPTPSGVLPHGETPQVEHATPLFVTWPDHAYSGSEPPTLQHSNDPQLLLMETELHADLDPANDESLVISAVIPGGKEPICAFTCFAPTREFRPGAGAVPGNWIVEVNEGFTPVRMPLIDYFNLYPPLVLLDSGLLVAGPRVFTPPTPSIMFSPGSLAAWDWHGTDIKSEIGQPAQGLINVQDATARNILAEWGRQTLLLTDHRTGEIADLIAISNEPFKGLSGRVGLFHCKGSHGAAPGLRVDDVYVVAGQAVKSHVWATNPRFFEELTSRYEEGRLSILSGDPKQLAALAGRSQRAYFFQTFIVQPGISIGQVTASPEDGRLALLASAYQWFHPSDLVIVGS